MHTSVGSLDDCDGGYENVNVKNFGCGSVAGDGAGAGGGVVSPPPSMQGFG